MGRKPAGEINRQDALIEAATSLFLNNGYDGTSIRAIMKEIDCEVGLFYYYYKDKSEVFDEAVKRLLIPVNELLESAVKRAFRNPCRDMQIIFEAFYRSLNEIGWNNRMMWHWSIQNAMKEEILSMLTLQMQRIFEFRRKNGANTCCEDTLLAHMMSYGIGAYLLAGNMVSDALPGICVVLGVEEENYRTKTPVLAGLNDYNGCLDLIERTIQVSSPAEMRKLSDLTRNKIKSGSMYVVRWRKQIIGAIAFDLDEQQINLIAVHPSFQRKDILPRLLESALAKYEVDTRVTITAPRNDMSDSYERYGVIREANPEKKRGYEYVLYASEFWSKLYKL